MELYKIIYRRYKMANDTRYKSVDSNRQSAKGTN